MPRTKFHTTPKPTPTAKAATTPTTGKQQTPKTTNDLLDDFKVPDNLRKTLEYPATKQIPLHQDWVEKFNLKDVKPLKSEASLVCKVTGISANFKNFSIPFAPYNLRHAYAIRGHALGIPLKEMADNMGHSVDMHTKTYQKYITLDTRKQVYSDAIKRNTEQQAKKTEVELLKEEVGYLKAQIEQLTLENQRLKLESAYHS